MTHNTLSNYYLVLLTTLAFTLQSCQGVFDNYDEPVAVKAVNGQLYVDATNWRKWYYIDLPGIVEKTAQDPSYDASQLIVSYDIPMTATGEQQQHPTEQLPGQYMYKFTAPIVSNQPVAEFQHFTPTDPQPEPPSTSSGQDSWTFAIHRTNIRTNGCSVYETQQTDIDALTKADYATGIFTEDSWNENQVWDDQSQMISYLMPSQGIEVNPILSTMLTMVINPPYITYPDNKHVFVLRLPDNTYGAIQLVNYLTPDGRACGFTIKYKYPL